MKALNRSVKLFCSRSCIFLLFILLTVSWTSAHAQSGYGMGDAISIPISSCSGGNFTDYQYTPNFGNYFGNSAPDVWYTFTLTDYTEMHISLCDSDFDTYLWLLDEYGNVIYYDDDSGCGGYNAEIYQYLTAGTYYVVAEGSNYNSGSLTMNVYAQGSGSPSLGSGLYNPVMAGSFSGSGSYTDTRSNADGCLGNNIGQASNDIYYQFTLAAASEVTLSHCGSGIDTYMHLLDASGSVIITNDDGPNPSCPGTAAYIQMALPAGTYYVVSEGYNINVGNIVTTISVVPSLAGSAPIIAYSSPSSFTVGTAISVISPTNTGGAVSSGGQSTTTLAGAGYAGSANGTGTAASFNNPLNAAVDASGNVYVADAGNHSIRKITPSGVVSTLAGAGYAGYADGTGTSAYFRHPSFIAIDGAGNVFVADQQNHRIRKITPAGVVSTFAGSGSIGSANGTGTAASFQYPMGLTFDASGNLYVADSYNNKIRKITPAGVVSNFAGSGALGAVDGAAGSASFKHPMGLGFDASGNLFVADRENYLVRKISTSGVVSTFAGNGTGGAVDGTGTAATFNTTNNLVLDAENNIYVADHNNHKIRKITPSGVVSTFAGTGIAGTVNGTGSAVRFNSPFGITRGGDGALYVIENNPNLVRKVVLLKAYTISPALPVGLTFNEGDGTISGTPTGVSPLTTYTITAYNNAGSASTTLSIEVVTGTFLDLDKNSVQTRSYDEDGNLIAESIIFLDNAGKAIQSQVKNLSSGQVLASEQLYDILGRPAVNTLVAPIDNSNFKYKALFVKTGSGQKYDYRSFDRDYTNNPAPVGNDTKGTLGWYYSNNNTIESHVSATAYPYSRMDYYKDGTGASKRSASVGDQLKMGSGHEDRSFTAPVANELDFYLQIRNKFFPTAVIGEVPSSLKNQAVQNIIHDANGNEAVVITDKSGQSLMSARPGNDLPVVNATILTPEDKSIHYFKLLSTSVVSVTPYSSSTKLYDMSGDEQEISWNGNGNLSSGYYKLEFNGNLGESITLNYTNSYTDISYNFYNANGQLLASIAPNGVKELITNGINAYSSLAAIPFVNTNEYDLQGRLIAATTTDAGRTEFAYREDGSIRFSQNIEQAKTGKFSYVNYDRWVRPVEAGEYLNENLSFATAKADENLKNNTNSDGGLIGGSRIGWVKTHYDEPNNDHGVSGYVQDEGFLKGVSWTEDEQNKTWYNYDSDGRVLWVVKSINGLGVKTIDYTYNSSGDVASVDFQKNNNLERFTHEYEYDADNRLKVAYTSASGSARKEQARYHYYLHGPLKRVELAENLQGLDYTYTPQGWLKSINHPMVGKDPGLDGTSNGFSADAFAMTLDYFNGDYTRNNTGISSLATGGQAHFNGSIMAQTWKSLKPQAIVGSYGAGVNNPAMVTYAYDNKYQFNNNKYGTPDFAGNSFIESLNANREHNLNYDPNGNIKTLGRTSASGASIADYNYTYQNGTNKLTGVGGYATYGYDDLGQMTQQTRNGGLGYYLNYDVNGKVTGIYSDVAKTQLRTSFGYDEGGLRIRKTDHLQNVVTYYVHDASGNLLAIYDNKGTALQQKEIPVYGSSRIGTYNRSDSNYQYELSDHLGNVRVVLNGTKLGNGDADVVYYSDYYPFGTALTLQGSNDYRYGYQGQYAEVDKETGWNNFELRMYDPAIGRWMSTDPEGQYYSPYLAMGNNPISSVDPDGGEDGEPKNAYKKNSNGDLEGNLSGVTITAKRMSAQERASVRGSNAEFFSNGQRDMGVVYANESYASHRANMAKQPQFDEYIADAALVLSGGEVFELAGAAYYGFVRVGALKLLARGISVEGTIKAVSTALQGGKSFLQYKAARGGTETLAKISTSTGVQRISTEFHHVFIPQRFQTAYNLPNWLVNNRLNVWKLNSVQHSLLDSYRFNFLRAGFKSDVGWFGKYNWFTKF